jgi:hypothetical protein
MIELRKKPRIDVLRINCYGRHDLEDDGWISRVLAATGVVAAVVPVRFSSDDGVHWTRFAAEGAPRAAFDEACLTSQVEWYGCDVGFGGNIAALAASQTAVAHPTPFNHVTVSVDPHQPSTTPTAALDPLLRAMIEATGAVYAYGSWQRDVLFDKRRNLLWDKKSDHAEPFALMSAQWRGLPADHVLLEWFGSEYLPLVEDPLTGLTRPFAGGSLATYGWDSDERDQRLPRALIADPRADGRPALVPAGW